MVPNGVTGRVKEVLLVILRLMKRFIFLRHQKENAPFRCCKMARTAQSSSQTEIKSGRANDHWAASDRHFLSNRKGEPLRSLAPSVREKQWSNIKLLNGQMWT